MSQSPNFRLAGRVAPVARGHARDAVMAGDGAAAEALARQHITQAAAVMIERLRSEAAAPRQRQASAAR